MLLGRCCTWTTVRTWADGRGFGGFIATSGDFFDQPKVADAVSDLFRDIFGIEKMPVRLVIGVASLPLGMPIELDVIFEVAE
jgi:enamine deaminase RidA (YjgF/YER057c/UK114 family)